MESVDAIARIGRFGPLRLEVEAAGSGPSPPAPLAQARPAPVSDLQGSLTDADLVARVRRGDGRAFESLVRRHLRAARAVARTTVGNEDDADDVVQEAFIRALERIDDCDPARFRAWLLTIVRNRAHNYRERERVRETAPLDPELAGSDRNDPSRALERRELAEEIGVALESLTSLQRSVVLLYDFEGWKHAEIAAELGISSGSSRVHLHAARRALRKVLGPRYGRLRR